MSFRACYRGLIAPFAAVPVRGRWVISTSLLLALGLWSVGAVVLWTMHNADLEKARSANANIVSTIEADIARNIEIYDLSLQAVVDNLQHPQFETVGKDLQRLILFDRAATAKHLGELLVVDEDGRVEFDNTSAEPRTTDFSERPVFRWHRENRDLRIHISPAKMSDSGKAVVTISRRINHADGSFAGIVIGCLETEYFQELFAKVTMLFGGAIGLVYDDGTIIARRPFNPNEAGRSLQNSRLIQQALERSEGDFTAVAVTDGTSRLYSFKRIGSLPLLISMGVSLDTVYAQWRRTAASLAGMLLVLGLAMIALACLAARELRDRAVEIKRRLAAEYRLQLLVATDPLTGLGNRRKFDDSLKQELQRGRRQRTPLAVLMIDVDHFKQFNDRFGHQRGDRALVRLAEVLLESTRFALDVVCRYGGEEFAIILPGTSADGGFAIAERIRMRIADLNAKQTGGSILPTFSIGVCGWEASDLTTPDDLVAAADIVLYSAKRNGRNQTCVHSHRPVDTEAAA